MASLADYYTPAGGGGRALPFQLADIAIEEGNARTDAGLAQSRMGTMFGRAQTDLVNAYSSRGTVRGGMAGVAADEQRADYDWQNADVSRQLDRQLSNLSRNRILATLGTMI